jgi:putative membrane protein
MHALAEMRARLSAAHSLAASTAERTPDNAVVAERATELLALSPRDLLLCGFIENRGMFLILTALGLLSQLDGASERVVQWMEQRLPWLGATIGAAQDTVMRGTITVGNVAAVLAALFVVLLFIRVLSMVWAVVRLYDYRLRREGDDLRAEYGLLTRVVATIPLRRIQVISIDETLLHRVFGLAAVRVTTAGGGTGAGGTREREWLAPLVARTALPPLIERVQPGLDMLVDWQPVHPRAFRRVFIVSALRAAAVAAIIALFDVRLAVPVLLILLVRAWLRSRMRVRHLGWGLSSNAVLMRGGWLRRRTSAIRYSRIQSVAALQTPFDRRAGMATILVDAAGGGGRDVPYLAEQTAADLRVSITGRAAAAVFTW